MSIQEILESAGLPAQRGVYTGRDKPDAYYTFLPPLMSGVQDLLNTLVGMLPEMISIIGQIIPTIIDTLLTILPQLLEAGVQIITELAQGIAQALPTLLGAFTSLENAKSACKAGYTVYDDNGKAVYTAAGQQASVGVPFSVQVDILDLNIRTGAGTNYAKTGETTGKGVFTIVEVKAGQGASVGWGRLKSGAGWISLDYATRLA